MEDTIFDGEAHVLSEKFGYIADKVREIENISGLQEIIDEQLETYAEYLFENDKERVIEYLLSIFRMQVMRQCSDDHYQVIYRPPHMVSCLAQYGTLCLKFQRAENDNLDKKNAESRKGCCCR